MLSISLAFPAEVLCIQIMQIHSLAKRLTLITVLLGFYSCILADDNYGPRSFEGEPLTAIVAAYRPEIEALLEEIENRDDTTIEKQISFRGVTYYLGHFKSEPIVIFVTGVSIPNAAMTMQMAFDYFPIKQVVYAGIAGGINEDLHPGDVVIPERWYYHDEIALFNPDKENPEEYVVADYYTEAMNIRAKDTANIPHQPKYENFGMIHPNEVEIIKEGWEKPTDISYYSADPELLKAAQTAVNKLGNLPTSDTRNAELIVGGNGVSGSVFADNAEFRKWLRRVYNAEVTEMESAAVAQVCFINDKPWIIIRAVSDIAGGQEGKNVENVYDKVASINATKVLFALLTVLFEK